MRRLKCFSEKVFKVACIIPLRSRVVTLNLLLKTVKLIY